MPKPKASLKLQKAAKTNKTSSGKTRKTTMTNKQQLYMKGGILPILGMAARAAAPTIVRTIAKEAPTIARTIAKEAPKKKSFFKSVTDGIQNFLGRKKSNALTDSFDNHSSDDKQEKSSALAPTDSPANAPTDSPANSPTDSPANAPTDVPANAPTDVPANAHANDKHAENPEKSDNKARKARKTRNSRSSFSLGSLSGQHASYSFDSPSSYSNSDYSSNYASSSSGGKTNENISNIKYLVNTFMDTVFPAALILIWFITIIIVVICIFNFIIFGFVIVREFLKDTSDTVLKDSFKYKLLQYVDYYSRLQTDKPQGAINVAAESIAEVKASNNSEPYFYLMLINFLLSVMVIIYCILVILYLFGLIVYLLLNMLAMKSSAANIQSVQENDKGTNIFTKHLSIATFMGFLFVLLMYGLYALFFKNLIYYKLKTIRDAIHKIDYVILKGLDGLGSGIDMDLVNLLKNKGKENSNGAYTIFNDYIMKSISKNDHNVTVNLILFLTLYSHLYDNIPDTNTDAMKKIIEYFFVSPMEGNFAVAPERDLTLTYISLMPLSKGITQVKRIYENFDFYTIKNQDIIIIKRNLESKMNEINNMILEFPEFVNTAHLFGGYLMIMMFFAVIFLWLYNHIIITSKKEDDLNKTVGNAASSMNGVIQYMFWFFTPIFLSASSADETLECQLRSQTVGDTYAGQLTACINDSKNGRIRQNGKNQIMGQDGQMMEQNGQFSYDNNNDKSS